MPLSVPVTKPLGNHTPTNQILLRNEDKWFIKHRRAIQSAYESSPFYLYYKDDLNELLSGNYDNLMKLNHAIILKICDLIQIKPQITFTEEFEKEPVTAVDLRNEINPKKEPIAAEFPFYIQVFSDRKGFIPNLSMLDVLFNLGSESKTYLENITFDL